MRFQGERPGDGDTLLLSAREAAGEGVAEGWIETDEREQLATPLGHSRNEPVVTEHLVDRLAGTLAGIE